MGMPAVFSMIYVPRTPIVHGDASATASNILVLETFFRVGIVSEPVARLPNVDVLNRVARIQPVRITDRCSLDGGVFRTTDEGVLVPWRDASAGA